jgi:CP family cyanate transporter-like MFS transporter
LRNIWWLCGVILVAANLRPAIASVPPLADTIGADLHLSATALGVLTTLPVLCMGLFAPFGAPAARRFGSDRVLGAAVALIAAGTALRAVPGSIVLYASSAVAGIGIAVAGALLPPLVRVRFPARIGPVTGAYTAGLIGGALLAASLTAPLHTGWRLGWPAALAVWALPAVLALAVWLAVSRSAAGVGADSGAGVDGPGVGAAAGSRAGAGAGAGPGADAGVVAGSGAGGGLGSGPAGVPWRSSRAWFATFFMGGQSLLYYAPLAWLAARYTSTGSSAAEAGLLLGLFSATQLASALGVPLLAHRFGDPRPWIAACLGLTGVSLALVAFLPQVTPWLWASTLGVGVGGQFALAMMVLSALGATPRESASVTGMALFFGYLLAAAGPVLAGVLRDATGSYVVPFAAMALFAVPVMLAGLRAAGRTSTPHRPLPPAGPTFQDRRPQAAGPGTGACDGPIEAACGDRDADFEPPA